MIAGDFVNSFNMQPREVNHACPADGIIDIDTYVFDGEFGWDVSWGGDANAEWDEIDDFCSQVENEFEEFVESYRQELEDAWRSR